MTSTHALRTITDGHRSDINRMIAHPHLIEARNLSEAASAEKAFEILANKIRRGIECDFSRVKDENRRRILIPMIRAEMKRRERAKNVETKNENSLEVVYT